MRESSCIICAVNSRLLSHVVLQKQEILAGVHGQLLMLFCFSPAATNGILIFYRGLVINTDKARYMLSCPVHEMSSHAEDFKTPAQNCSIHELGTQSVLLLPISRTGQQCCPVHELDSFIDWA